MNLIPKFQLFTDKLKTEGWLPIKEKLFGTEERPTALRLLPGEIQKRIEMPQGIKEFITPSPEEARKWGMVDIGKGEEPQYFDPFGAIGGMKMVGGKAAQAAPKVFAGFKDLTTKVIEKLKGRSTVSKQFISDLTNMPELKQAERNVIREVLETQKVDPIPVQEFANKVKSELLPLKISKQYTQSTAYENITLPDELRGNVANYAEHIWESPIKTSAAETHFGGKSQNYFGHTRIEDMARTKGGIDIPKGRVREGEYPDVFKRGKGDIGVRRVIELQSDLYQKGALTEEILETTKVEKSIFANMNPEMRAEKVAKLSKLQQYNDPTAHFRMAREEVKQAAIDGKTKLQFPTGETAMKIEGLGEPEQFQLITKGVARGFLQSEQLKVGQEVISGQVYGGENVFIITDILGEGKFKAVPKDIFGKRHPDFVKKFWDKAIDKMNKAEKMVYDNIISRQESFDISGKVDTNNPIYRFYEKDLGKYLRNKFSANLIKDNQGVSWWEIAIRPEHKTSPVEAFGIGAIPFMSEEQNVPFAPKTQLFIDK